VFFLENSSAISIQSAGSPDEVLAGQYIANTQEAHTRNNASIPKIVATPAKEQKGMGGYIHPHEKNRGHNSSIPLRQVTEQQLRCKSLPRAVAKCLILHYSIVSRETAVFLSTEGREGGCLGGASNTLSTTVPMKGKLE
jgi:hypothetical protein